MGIKVFEQYFKEIGFYPEKEKISEEFLHKVFHVET
jgi:hypothetical protein